MARQRVPYIVTSECINCGVCVELCPEVFQISEKDGYAIVVDQAGASADRIQEAMDNCPTHCIHWED